MTPDIVLAELERYESELTRILCRFRRTSNGIYIGEGDDSLYRQYARELVDLYNDALGPNVYSKQLSVEYSNGFGMYGAPSYKGVENVLAVVKASITRLRRSPDLLTKKESQDALQHRENVFIIHGRDEAKWRELKDIVKSEFRLKPIVLLEQPDAGCKTVIEKFEKYAQTCTYAIAVFTPDDEVRSGSGVYLQARPNVIYELGWFCGSLGRGGAMLLLKEGTELFSDFGGIVQKRFKHNVSERLLEIRRDLEAAGVLSPAEA
ncbi:TIR domain-containing protein [Azohydromonas aeria]|uniref:TIR domain-containing protein n=1 Tax=Azohydromonas aeria TaxID=2590212 RepID=UPI0012F76477|nr:nucleotide-binding protein [Azohydromonas aeria]